MRKNILLKCFILKSDTNLCRTQILGIPSPCDVPYKVSKPTPDTRTVNPNEGAAARASPLLHARITVQLQPAGTVSSV